MPVHAICQTIWRIAGRPTMTGYQQLTLAVFLVLRQGAFPVRRLTKQLYPQVAHMTGQSSQSISRSIARAAADCWDHGSRRELERIAGHRLTEKPSPGELIFYLYRYIGRTEESH